jgi:dolichol-phosphate mannosyltransferase
MSAVSRRFGSPLRRLVVVMPVYNEADSIEAVLAEVLEMSVRLQLGAVATTVLIIDDGSPDGSGGLAQQFGERYGLDVRVLVGQRDGLGSAMLRGLAAALELEPEAIVTLDADGQHNPSDIPTLHRALVSRGADIVIGSRWTRGGRSPGTSSARSLGSRVGNLIFRVVTGTRGVADATTSFRVYSPRVARFLLGTNSSRYTGYSFFSTTVALAEAAGYVISEVPIEFRPRYGGASKLNKAEARSYFVTLPTLRDERRHALAASAASEYLATKEMEWLDKAVAWNRYVVDCTLGEVEASTVRTIAEVGAGVGAVTAELTSRFPNAEIYAFEPDLANFEALSQRFRDSVLVHPIHGSLTTDGCRLTADGVDLVVYVNVLEHIDGEELELAGALLRLRPGGHLAIFVPGQPWLFGPIDARSGHYRRYTSASLGAVVERAGFTIQRLGYADRLGVVPYWIQFRLLNKAGVPVSSPAMFDRFFVPATRALDRLIAPSVPGKNVVCLARR